MVKEIDKLRSRVKRAEREANRRIETLATNLNHGDHHTLLMACYKARDVLEVKLWNVVSAFQHGGLLDEIDAIVARLRVAIHDAEQRAIAARDEHTRREISRLKVEEREINARKPR
jgi:hypothetical protein